MSSSRCSRRSVGGVVFLVAAFLECCPAIAVANAAGEASRSSAAAPSSCITCHAEGDDELAAPVRLWATDVHAEAGLGCDGCHGGDPAQEDKELAMAPERGFVSAPGRLQVADFCSRCHADAEFMKRFDPQARIDQLAEYRTSVHGMKNAAGDSIPATCIDCHGSHGVQPVTSPNAPVYATNVPRTCARCHSDETMMSAYGIPTDQYASYSRSVHAAALVERGDLAAPACNDCHGNHGAAPPGVQSVANVCGQCHGREATLFSNSFKKEVFEDAGAGECTVCHDHHRIRHPTPELFHGGSSPRLSRGSMTSDDPFAADLGSMEAGDTITAEWRVTLLPHLAPSDPRYADTVVVATAGAETLALDATVRPGDSVRSGRDLRRAAGSSIVAALEIEPLSGEPVQAGDALLLRLTVAATAAAPSVLLQTRPREAVEPIAGSACLTCHEIGDACDQATERMYSALSALDRELREAETILRRAELAGVEVSEAAFTLKSKGVTTAVESRAFIHAFDEERLIGRTKDGSVVAADAKAAGYAALAEIQTRRKGLAVSLVLVAAVLALLFAKIREIDRARRGDAASTPSTLP